MQVILSTRNPSKAEQIKAVFAGSSISILTLDQVGIAGEGIEDGDTLEANALKKALFAHQAKPGFWTMADDTGIFIAALDGKPGVQTAYWPNWRNTDKKITEVTDWILGQLENAKNRSATFRTVVAIVSPQGKQYYFTGEVHGEILQKVKGKPELQMPYGTIFLPDGAYKVFGEMNLSEKNTFSHRGKAFRQARAYLESQA